MRWQGTLLLAASAAALPALWAFVTTPLSAGPQLVLGLTLLGAALLLDRRRGAVATRMLAVCSVAVSLRYLYWRVTRTFEFDSPAAAVCGALLLGAELYAFAVLMLGFFQTVQPFGRHPTPLPKDPARWPTVDVFIPTYNEPRSVVRPTVLAALALDWPRDRLRVHLLDDGRRPAFRAFAAAAGARYVTRPDNLHAKAGNLNHALGVTDGELVAVFDCDHVATRSFLQLTAGWFLRDERLALVQTPHHFYNADPIERNTRQFRRVPNEGELFYGLIQPGNDFWNASFFCGSCAVLRRSALVEVGGIQTESITEDALTALRLQRRGWSTAYLSIRQAAGLATDTLAAHVTQRIRWAQGMVQILRVDNPLGGRGLGLAQRLCYLNAILHFLYAVPRLVFLAAPLAYLLFGLHICHTAAPVLLAYVLPHLVFARLANARQTGRFRYAFWDQVYETILAFYILVPTLTALLRPRAGVFKVTDKGATIEHGGLDRRLAWPYAAMLVALAVGLAVGAARLLATGGDDVGTVLVNAAWSAGSIVVLGAALCVAWEQPQRRATYRVAMQLRAMVTAPSGHTRSANLLDLSLGGCLLRLGDGIAVEPGDRVTVGLFAGEREHALRGNVVAAAGATLRVSFGELPLDEEARLVEVLFGRPDAWLDWDRRRAPDHPLASFATVVATGLGAIGRVAAAERRIAASATAVVAIAGAVSLLAQTGFHLQPLFDRLAQLPGAVLEQAALDSPPSQSGP